MFTPATKRTTATTTQTPTERINGATRSPEPVYDPLYDPAYLRVAFPPNEEPMADSARLMTYFLMLITPLRQFFKDQPDTLVNGDIFLFYDKSDLSKLVSPDLIIAFGVNVAQIIESGSYFAWMMGKPPEFVMEIGSKSTAKRDLEFKRGLYARLGIRNYWLFDPPDGSRYGFILKGFRLARGEYQEIPMIEGPGDNIRGHSDALGLDLCWENGSIRFYNPATGEYLRNFEDSEMALAAEVAARERAEAEIRRLRALIGE